MAKLVDYTVDKGLAIIELNNPPAHAYGHEMMRDLDDAILQARFDDDVHVIILRGKGEKFFCGGADIKMLNEKSPSYFYNFSLHAQETARRLELTPKLVIAAINGHCMGGGLEVALAPTEFRLLRVLMERPGRVYSREQLLDLVWGRDSEVELRTVDVHVRRLRVSLNANDAPDLIRTVRSEGYSLEPQAN